MVPRRRRGEAVLGSIDRGSFSDEFAVCDPEARVTENIEHNGVDRDEKRREENDREDSTEGPTT